MIQAHADGDCMLTIPMWSRERINCNDNPRQNNDFLQLAVQGLSLLQDTLCMLSKWHNMQRCKLWQLVTEKENLYEICDKSPIVRWSLPVSK